jgi:hypothetical protein
MLFLLLVELVLDDVAAHSFRHHIPDGPPRPHPARHGSGGHHHAGGILRDHHSIGNTGELVRQFHQINGKAGTGQHADLAQVQQTFRLVPAGEIMQESLPIKNQKSSAGQDARARATISTV